MRRPSLIVSLCAVCLMVAGPASAGPRESPSTADQAVAYQIDPAHDGLATGSALVPPLTERWRVTLNGAISYPLIADGKVFVTVKNGTDHGTGLVALDASSGAVLWRRVLSTTTDWANAAYDSGTVFTVDFDGKATAFDAATGTSVWQVQLAQDFFESPPVAVEGIVYTVGAGTNAARLFAVNETDGAVLWAVGTSFTGGSPAVGGERMFTSSTHCVRVQANNRLSGALLWRHTGGCGVPDAGRTPVYYQGRLYVRDMPEHLPPPGYLFDSRDGTLVRRYLALRAPAFDGTSAFVLTTPAAGGDLIATDLSMRNQAWEAAGDGHLVTAPVVANGVVYMGSSLGTVFAFDESTGTVLWQVDTGVGIPAPEEDYPQEEPLTGLGIGQGLLVVPGGRVLIAYGN